MPLVCVDILYYIHVVHEMVECVIAVIKLRFCNLATFTVVWILVLHITCRRLFLPVHCHYATYLIVYPLTL